MGRPKKLTVDEINPVLAAVFRSVGLPRSAWPGTVAKMSDGVVAELIGTIADGRATPATRAAYQKWQQDRRSKIAVAAKGESRETVVSTNDESLTPDWTSV